MRKKSENTLPRAERYKVISRRRRVWHKIVGALACVVVFITTYMLILPAITMEKPICGFEEHTHTAECYEKVTGTVIEFVCNPPEPCAHTHNEYCYDKDGNLICTLPEIEQHIHTEGCYAESESVGGHVHTDECYTEQRGELVCGQDESEGHTHDDSCYDTALTCTEDEGGGHSHDDSCYDEQGELVCGQDESEGHTHDDGCYETVLVCAEEESEGHTHTEDCYEHQRVLSCGLEEAAGLEAEPEIICGIEELPVHNHTSECIIENPVNSDELTCTLDEDENHTHTERCYGEWRLSCGFEEHTHTDDCYPKKDSSGNSKAPSDIEEAEDIQEKEESEKSGGNNSGENNEDGEDGEDSEDGNESKTKLTEEQIAEANEVTKLIAVLPDTLEVEKKLSELEQAGDEQAYKAYFMDIVNKSLAAYSRYSALSEEQKKLVIGADKLERLEWLYSAQAFADIPERLNGDYAYISSLSMKADSETTSKQAIRTGNAPFDSDDTAGNDKSANNDIVRTFDTVSYTFTYQTKSWDNSTLYKTGTVYFEFLLPLTSDQAQFETESMGWLATSQEIEYEVKEVTVGETKYQVLHGSFLAVPSDNNESVIGASTDEMTVAIRVKNMKNGETVQPSFTLWLYGNNVGTDYTRTNESTGGIPKEIVYLNGSACATPTHGTEYKTVTPPAVTVSAAPRYNVAIKQAEESTTSYYGDFDFATGNDKALNKDKSTVTGRIVGYGITLQLYGNSKDHGLRGVELPDEKTPITFDIKLQSLYKRAGVADADITKTGYGLLVWSADMNSNNNQINSYQHFQRDGRNTLMESGPHTVGLTYAKDGAPLNKKEENSGGDFVDRTCWNGGDWSFTQDLTDSNVVHVTVSGFEVKLDNEYDSKGNIVRPFPRGNAGGQSLYYNPDTLKNNWDIQIGCFSAGELWVVQPYYDVSGKHIVDEYGPGSLQIKVSDSNLNMQSASGAALSVQANTGDDSVLTGLLFEKKGSIRSDVWYNKYNKGYNNPLTAGCMGNGKDWATPGTKMSIEEMISNDNAEGMNTGVAYDTFVKFDNAFFEPDYGKDSHQCYMYPKWKTEGVTKYLYAGKSGGWNHDGKEPNEPGYDDDMIKATADSPELTFYENLNELKADGMECVGILLEYRGLATTGMNHLEQVINGKIKGNCKTLPTSGYVYMVTHNNRSWNKEDVKKYAAAYKKLIDEGVTPSIITAEQAEAVTAEMIAALTDNYYDAYARSAAFPSHSDNNVTYDNFPSAYWIKQYGEIGDDSQGFATMNKSTYNESGYTGGDYDPKYLDSCLVVGLSTNITKKVAQAASASDLTAKRVFDLNQSQRVVDYKLIPSTKRLLEGNDTSSLAAVTTNIYIEDTLPKGLNYIPGSSYWGGNYTQDVNCRKKGTVTGGTQIEPSVVSNADGTTTLTWTLNNVSIPASPNINEISPLYFSCDIGNAGGEGDVEHQQLLKNIVEIHSDCDKQLARTVAFGNRSETSIEIYKTMALSLSKFAEQSVVERGSEMSFSMNVGNNSGTAIIDSVIVESLPHSSGTNGSSFNGAIYVKEFSAGTLLEKWSSSSGSASSSGSSQYAEDNSVYVDGTPIFGMDAPDTAADDELMNGLKFYYTTDTNKRGNTSKNYLIDSKANRDEFTEANGWHEIIFDNNAQKVEGRPLNIAKNIPADVEIVQIAAVGKIPAEQTLKMHITLNLPYANSGETVVNGLSQGELESYARSSIVLRTLEGQCWHDDNADGVQNDNELRLSGIKVTLLKLKDGGDYTKLEDYEPYHYGGVSTNAEVTIETGKQVSVRDGIITDYTDPSDSSRSVGCYKFTELPEGTFAVKFEDGTHTMSKYIASPVDMGGDDRHDSDGIAVYNNDRTRIEYTYILNVEMPATADMKVALYESRYHDSGFYDRGPELPTTGGTGTKLYIIGGLLLTAAAGISLLYKRKRHGREDSLLF